MILITSHNISFYGEINKNTPKLSPNTLLICSTVDNNFLYISHKISYRPAFLSLSICLYINMYAFVELQKKKILFMKISDQICPILPCPSIISIKVLVWFLFYSPSTHFRLFRARSVTLTTLFLGKPPSISEIFSAYSFTRNWQLLFLNQEKRENASRKFFMTKSPWKNVSDVGIELWATCLPD